MNAWDSRSCAGQGETETSSLSSVHLKKMSCDCDVWWQVCLVAEVEGHPFLLKIAWLECYNFF